MAITLGSPGLPPLSWGGAWPATQAYLHLVTQMMGKLCLALSPIQPEWFHASLAVTARGLTTRLLPAGEGSIEVTLDLTDAALSMLRSDGRTRRLPLLPTRPIADVWADYTDGLRGLGVTVAMWDKPQEMPASAPFSEDLRERMYDAPSVSAWFTALTTAHTLFDEWRSPFFGRTGIAFWWGAFDLSVMAFSGRHATPRPGADFIMRHDLDAEFLAMGLWPGDADHEALFYGYIVPEPPGCAYHPLDAPAGWVETMGEWVLPYEAVRTASDPRTTLLGFMDQVQAAAGELAGWDLALHRYERPPRPAPAAARALGATASHRDGGKA